MHKLTWLRGRWHGWLLSSLHSWGWSIVRIGRWDHVRRIGASWIWCWIWIRIRIGIGIGIWVWIRVWRWSVIGSWCQCWIGASDTASYSRWLVRIGLVTLWDLATFGIIGIWDHDTAGGNVRILSTSGTKFKYALNYNFFNKWNRKHFLKLAISLYMYISIKISRRSSDYSTDLAKNFTDDF